MHVYFEVSPIDFSGSCSLVIVPTIAALNIWDSLYSESGSSNLFGSHVPLKLAGFLDKFIQNWNERILKQLVKICNQNFHLLL